MGDNLSMFKTVEKQGVQIEQQENILNDHAIQLRIQSEQIKQLQDNGIRLESVVMSENQATRLTITQTNGQLLEMINRLMGYNAGQSQMSNNLRMARWESLAKIVGLLAGSGGILYYVFGK